MSRLREVRKNKRLTQQQVADFIGIGQNTYSYWERGRNRIDDASLAKLSKLFGVSVDYLLGVDGESTGAIKGIKIPVLGKVQAGIPTTAVEDILDYEEITPEMAAQGEHFALQVRGNSMQPKMDEGDVVIVRQQPDVDSGDTAIVLVNGDDATIKKIKKMDSGIMLIPMNPAYEPLFYSRDEIENLPVMILGKVIELRCKF